MLPTLIIDLTLCLYLEYGFVRTDISVELMFQKLYSVYGSLN